MIRRWLLAKLMSRIGEGLLNLKDLLTVSPPSLERLLENEAVLEPSSLCRIAPNSVIFRRKRAHHRGKSGFSATDLGPNKPIWGGWWQANGAGSAGVPLALLFVYDGTRSTDDHIWGCGQEPAGRPRSQAKLGQCRRPPALDRFPRLCYDGGLLHGGRARCDGTLWDRSAPPRLTAITEDVR